MDTLEDLRLDRAHLAHLLYLTGGIGAVQGREHGTTWQVNNLVALLEDREMRALA